jgi:trans-2,3-dihydro-3-hydroxyanthranilate isomerase
VELGSNGVARASMLQEPAEFGPELDAARVLDALGLDTADGDPELPPQVVSTGVAQLMVPVRDATVLTRAHPRAEALGPVLSDAGAVTAYVAFHDAANDAAQARSYFMTNEVVAEDPATGSAAGPLCAYLHARTGASRVDIEQGVAMGRPSRLICEAGERVRVAGDVVLLAEGEIEL